MRQYNPIVVLMVGRVDDVEKEVQDGGDALFAKAGKGQKKCYLYALQEGAGFGVTLVKENDKGIEDMAQAALYVVGHGAATKGALMSQVGTGFAVSPDELYEAVLATQIKCAYINIIACYLGEKLSNRDVIDQLDLMVYAIQHSSEAPEVWFRGHHSFMDPFTKRFSQWERPPAIAGYDNYVAVGEQGHKGNRKHKFIYKYQGGVWVRQKANVWNPKKRK